MTTLDDLLPKAADCRRRIAEVEAEKATEFLRKENAAEAEKRELLARLSNPSGVSDDERMKRAAVIIKRAVDNGLTEVRVGRVPEHTMYRSGPRHQSAGAGVGGDAHRIAKGALRLLEELPATARLSDQIRDRRFPERNAGRPRHHVELEVMATSVARAEDHRHARQGERSGPRRQTQAEGLREGAAQASSRTMPPAGLGQTQGIARHHHLRGARRRRQGRHHQGDHRAGQPAGVPRGRAAGPLGTPEDTVVRTALHSSSSRPPAKS